MNLFHHCSAGLTLRGGLRLARLFIFYFFKKNQTKKIKIIIINYVVLGIEPPYPSSFTNGDALKYQVKVP